VSLRGVEIETSVVLSQSRSFRGPVFARRRPSSIPRLDVGGAQPPRVAELKSSHVYSQKFQDLKGSESSDYEAFPRLDGPSGTTSHPDEGEAICGSQRAATLSRAADHQARGLIRLLGGVDHVGGRARTIDRRDLARQCRHLGASVGPHSAIGAMMPLALASAYFLVHSPVPAS